MGIPHKIHQKATTNSQTNVKEYCFHRTIA